MKFLMKLFGRSSDRPPPPKPEPKKFWAGDHPSDEQITHAYNPALILEDEEKVEVMLHISDCRRCMASAIIPKL